MSLARDIARFLVLQTVVICSIFLALDVLKLINAVVFDGVEFSRILTILASTRGSEIISVTFIYAFFCGIFYGKFANLHLLVKEATCFILMATASALSAAVYHIEWFNLF